MRALSAQELLGIWECGLTQPPLERALVLLAAACPEASGDTLKQLSIGQRDARLLTLRECTFGSRLIGLAACPGCGERLELEFSTSDVRAETGDEPSGLLQLNVDDYDIRFRLPNSQDLMALADQRDMATARATLLESCLLSADQRGERRPADSLPPTVVAAIVERMAQADPQANVQLALTCLHCAYQWQIDFDVAAFFWDEINAWAGRILREVHVLASAYGWRETDILALTPARRQVYLDLVGAS